MNHRQRAIVITFLCDIPQKQQRWAGTIRAFVNKGNQLASQKFWP